MVRNLRVGFIPSFDKTLEQSLTALGVNAREVSIEQVQKGELADYDTLIIDNRGYYAHPELIAANSNLLNYVREGGTLIVFYHKTEEWNPDPAKGRPQLAPFPIILGNERVTQETAPIKFLEPEHRLLNFPNRITRADFDRWIQERGLYFPKEWDPKYQALFETADEGEPPLKGGLLVGEIRAWELHLHEPGVVQATGGGRTGSLSNVCEHDQLRTSAKEKVNPAPIGTD